MTFRTLPRSSGKSPAAQRIREAGEAYQRAHPVKAEEPKPKPIVVKDLPPPVKRERIVAVPDTRRIVALALPPRFERQAVEGPMPRIAVAEPTALLIEEAYQRSLSAKSTNLIARIVARWSWAKFKPPIVVERDEGLFVIDGQHTAIAAATHPDIREIPILIVSADSIAQRADAFVAHNRDRLPMSQHQLFHAEVASGNATAVGVAAAVAAAGASIPRNPVSRANAHIGQIVSVGEVRHVYEKDGADVLTRVLRIAVKARAMPIQVTLVRALRAILINQRFAPAAALSDEKLAAAVASFRNIDLEARRMADAKDISRHEACALLICRAAGVKVDA